ncbi:sensor histidine kinase [Kocuria nitroreducens]|uniref:sensor histidine kinase n=1 Tax=Kocuria nitroreducens TaxID=3058914 RepID=UPI0036D95DB5
MRHSPRTFSSASILDAEPVARWLSVVIVLAAVVWFAADLQELYSDFQKGEPLEGLAALNGFLSYGALALTAWRSTWASLFSVTCLTTSLILGDYGSLVTGFAAVTIAVVATASAPFVKAHMIVYGAWCIPAYLRRPEEPNILIGLTGLLLVSFVIGSTIRHFSQQRRRNEQQVRDLEILNERLREDERQALARDLHDVVAHELTLITMQTMSRRRSGDVGELHQVLETVEGAARSALHELRVLLRLLRNENEGAHPRDVTGAGLAIGSLEHVVTSLAASLRDLRFEPEVVVTGDLEAMPTTVRGTAARILQEAVTNIIKYAPNESRCRIEVTADDHELCLRVANPLPRSAQRTGAHSSELSSGLGLRGIAERVSLLGGHAESGSADGQWVLDVCLPVDGRDAL